MYGMWGMVERIQGHRIRCHNELAMFEAIANILYLMMLIPILLVLSAVITAVIVGVIVARGWYGR